MAPARTWRREIIETSRFAQVLRALQATHNTPLGLVNRTK
jgi:hypothetical protein